MPVFEVTARSTQQTGTPDKQRRTRARRRVRASLRLICTALILAVLSEILFRANLSILFFILLPGFVTIVWSPSQLSRLLRGTWRYSVLTLCLELLYFSAITGIEFFIHTPGFGLLYLYHGPPIAMIIIVTTTLAWAVILAPLRTLGQTFIERNYNRRDFEAARIIAAFASTLREEIDLDNVRDGLLIVIQHTLQPLSAAIWVRKEIHPDSHRERMSDESTSDIPVADDDPFLFFALSHTGVLEIEGLHLQSLALHTLQARGVELVLPLASQGELIGLLTLGPRLNGEAYNRENKEVLHNLAAQVAPSLRVAQLVQEQEAQVRAQAAREEAARMAVMTERLRIARDLHDLLGHNLSLITLKSELARRLAGSASERLAAEIGDIETVARTTLQEVREAVSNYRQPTLSNELHGAQEILAAAGIICHYENNDETNGDLETLPTSIEAGLAWTIREGVTNVIRHSRAHSCTIRLTRTDHDVCIEIVNDGANTAELASQLPAHTAPLPAKSQGGNGLRGLAERVAALDGQFAAGPRAEGGFRLALSLPLTQKAGAETPANAIAFARASESASEHAP